MMSSAIPATIPYVAILIISIVARTRRTRKTEKIVIDAIGSIRTILQQGYVAISTGHDNIPIMFDAAKIAHKRF
jgi:ArsR family metal-binding transcriptional regulator